MFFRCVDSAVSAEQAPEYDLAAYDTEMATKPSRMTIMAATLSGLRIRLAEFIAERIRYNIREQIRFLIERLVYSAVVGAAPQGLAGGGYHTVG